MIPLTIESIHQGKERANRENVGILVDSHFECLHYNARLSERWLGYFLTTSQKIARLVVLYGRALWDQGGVF